MSLSADTVVDDEVHSDILDYYPTIASKTPAEIYYQLLTQHVKYSKANPTTAATAFQDDTLFLKESSSLAWRVLPPVQKRLEQIGHDWSIDPFMLPHIPNIFLNQDFVPLFLDESSSGLYSKIDLTTWSWQEKSKCFPLIKTTHPQCQAKTPKNQQDDKRKLHYLRSSIRKLAIFDKTCTFPEHQEIVADQHHRYPSDYGKEVSTQSYHYQPNQELHSSQEHKMDHSHPECSRGATTQHSHFNHLECTRQTTTAFHRTWNFFPQQQVDEFIKRKKAQPF